LKEVEPAKKVVASNPHVPSTLSEAEQPTAPPPHQPVHVQFHGPEPVTAELPYVELQRLDIGAKEYDPPLAGEEQTPAIA
jgi:hypothetical protein